MKKVTVLLLAVLLFFTASAPVFAQTVVFNTKTLKFHNFYCRWVSKCTVNCIRIEKKEAIKRGGIPCKVCGG